MSPDLYFAFTLIVKMAVTAAFLLMATVTAERAGPLIGGLVATLPISAGPVYIFLALDHDAHFIAQSALGSLVTNAVNVVFALTYALLAQKRSLPVSLGGAFAAWVGLIWASGWIAWTLRLGHRPQRRRSRARLLAVGAVASRADAARAGALVRSGAARRHGGAAGRRRRDAELPHRADGERQSGGVSRSCSPAS